MGNGLGFPFEVGGPVSGSVISWKSIFLYYKELGPIESNGCFGTLVSRNRAFMPETRVFHLFKTLPNIILGLTE
jgi:hypothetical protein